MIGCAAGEAHLDAEDEQSRAFVARALAEGIEDEARRLKTKLIVFKEFTKADRAALACLKDRGFAHVPSMPMTRLRLDCSSFNDYLCKTLSRNTRSQLRRKFKASEQRAQLRLSVVSDVTPHIDEIYPLYLAVYERSKLRLEKLTPEFFRKIGKSMPDKVRFFLWRNGDKIVAFNLCLTSADAVCSEYIGLDYAVAFDLHLYYVVLRDVIQWGFENGYKWYCSTALNYEPKYRFRQELEPLDLYVKHTSPLINFFLKRIVPLIEPTRHDKMLRRFPNYESLRA
jgi:predicted N-acyltransferase